MSKFSDHLKTGEVSQNIEDEDPIGNIIKSDTYLQSANYDQQINPSDSFLIDTFKRAREVGYPIGPLIQSNIFDPRPSTHFSTDEYDY